jgi:hypothetical protein
MDPFSSLQDPSTWLVVFLICLAILVALALVNYAVARLAERRHPATGSFMEVDGVRLHFRAEPRRRNATDTSKQLRGIGA